MYDAVKTIHDKGYFSPASMSTSHEGAIQYLGEKKAVMTFLSPGMAAPLEDPASYNMTLGFFYVPDWNGYNCISVTEGTTYAVNAKSKYASTAGVDLISCLIDESSLHLLNDNSGPVGYKNKTMRFNTLSGKMYQEALTKGPVVMQISSWLPESANLGVEIISSIFTGKGYSPQMLDEMQKNYDADKSLVNFSAFSD
jgi:hypothetical protein